MLFLGLYRTKAMMCRGSSSLIFSVCIWLPVQKSVTLCCITTQVLAIGESVEVSLRMSPGRYSTVDAKGNRTAQAGFYTVHNVLTIACSSGKLTSLVRRCKLVTWRLTSLWPAQMYRSSRCGTDHCALSRRCNIFSVVNIPSLEFDACKFDIILFHFCSIKIIRIL